MKHSKLTTLGLCALLVSPFALQGCGTAEEGGEANAAEQAEESHADEKDAGHEEGSHAEGEHEKDGDKGHAEGEGG